MILNENKNKNIDNPTINEIHHSNEDELLQKYLKVKSKYVTDGHGIVPGVLLVTPQTVMFNPCVSDHLVMERGVDMYMVRVPLHAISRIILFDDIAAMLVGDLAKQYVPQVEYFDYQPNYVSPKPGMVLCQETGEKYFIPTSVRGETELEKEKCEISNVESLEFAMEMDVSQESIELPKQDSDQSITVLGIGGSCEVMSQDSTTVGDITMTSQSSEPPPLSSKNSECEGFSDFVQQSQLSSTPKHETKERLTNASVTSTDYLLEHPLSTGVSEVPNEILGKESNIESNLDEDLPQCPEGIHLIEDHFNQTPDSSADQDKPTLKQTFSEPGVKGSTTTSNINSLELRNVSQSRNLGGKDRANTFDSFANSPTHKILQRATSISDEARQWLSKRGVTLDEESWDKEGSGDNQILPEDLSTPRPAATVDDHLMYVALKVHKTYWSPIRAKHNQIMGIPPNRDQKRREHWFAVPKDKADQFYNFLLYWSPDLYGGDSSGFSTPCSSECDNLDGKLVRADNKGFDSRSLHSVSSKGSLCSFGADEVPDLQTDSELLSKLHIQKLTRKLPSRTVGHSWELAYSTKIHGISLSTLYRNCQGYDSPILIVMKDENQKVFGTFLSDPPKVSEGFFGTGESMLFSFVTDTKLKTYMWTGDNNFFIKGSKTSFVVGGGEGIFGLWLDEDLYHGHSHSCRTFGNDTLSTDEDFICCGLEAWAFV